MKKLTLLILLFGVFVYSQNYDLNINLKDGSTVTIAVDDIQRLEFDNVTSIKDVKQFWNLLKFSRIIQILLTLQQQLHIKYRTHRTLYCTFMILMVSLLKNCSMKLRQKANIR